jgi:chemotaxis protein MotA
MDLGTVIGMVMINVLLLGAMAMGVGVAAYIDIPSVLIVFGGSIGALMIAFKLEQVKSMVKIISISIKPPAIENLQSLIQKLVNYSMKARRDGILSLESDANSEENDFLKKGLLMAVDGNEPDTIRELLEIDMEQTTDRHKTNASIFGKWGEIAGAFGMLGTLIGLVAMLVNMADPSAIGPAMAVALLTTFYGAFIGNIFGAPMENILLLRSSEEMLIKTVVIEGIMSIQAGDNPRMLEAKLLSFIPPNERVSQFE